MLVTASLLATLSAVGCTAAASVSEPSASTSGSGVRALPATEAAQLLDDPDVVVLDIRTPAEVAQGRLPGAVVLDFHSPQFAERVAELDRSATYLMYCRSGNRSSSARALMTQLGFEDVVDVRGGILEWADAGLPIER